MMYSRLLVARTLLKPDGIIFISIDDAEFTHLKKLCEEIFGEENFVCNLIWKSGRTAAAHFTNEHEYILCFAKDKSELPLFKFDGVENVSDRAIKRPSEKNPVSQISFPKGMDFECEDKIFPTEFGNGEPIKVISGIFESNAGKLANDVILEAAWTMKDMIESWIDGEMVIDQKGQIVKRFFFKDNGVLQYEKEKGTIHPKSIIIDFSTKNGTNALRALLGESYFEFPKPPGLLKHLYEITSDKTDIVLDFFSGSGTTGQAVMELNEEDGGNRKFILVQIPEATEQSSEAYQAGYKKISDITIERNKRVVERIQSEQRLRGLNDEQDLFNNQAHQENPLHQGSDSGLGFKVFKLVKSNFPRVEFAPDPESTTEENIALLKQYIKDKEAQLVSAFNRDELITEILLKNGYTLNYTVTKQEEFVNNEIFFATDGTKETLICLDIALATETVEYFKKHTDRRFICLERALDTTKKWNLKHYLGDKFHAF